MNKVLTVDWDSYESVSHLGNMIKSRLGELNPNRISKREKFRRVFDACRQIWDLNILDHYASLNLDPERKYYVYSHLDPTKKIAIEYNPKTTFGATIGMSHIPFYIGKGTGERYSDFSRNDTHRKVRQHLSPASPLAMIIRQGLTEVEALSLEDKLIDIFGLKVFGGYLTNLDEGYHSSERRKLYAQQYSLMVRDAREHRGSTPLPSTKAFESASAGG